MLNDIFTGEELLQFRYLEIKIDMKDLQLYSEISALPDSLKQEVKDFVDFLNSKKKSGEKE